MVYKGTVYIVEIYSVIVWKCKFKFAALSFIKVQ